MQSKKMPKNKRLDVRPVKKVTLSNMGTGGAEEMIQVRKQSIPPKRLEWNSVFVRLTPSPLVLLLIAVTSPLSCLLCQLHSFGSGVPFIGPGEGKEIGRAHV